ncbi:hypothetical protein A1O1_08855 [Capronia coronata CBS 617.96]|uniref:Uncharacterized protein n=1 Tax=Capronia coronata CBS 617.96 TaxID=1182541 RepID=W9XMA6_9EURO|nr:uncharacterized protein A1O1_08855 [Capronia coronata CBS 617.96]EXJ78455.1 hypothetical protein A1O1_08855 [Capronia coronata CBS 617.96]
MTSDRLMRLWRQCSEEFNLTPIAAHPATPRGSLSHDDFASTQIRTRSSSLSPRSELRPISDSSHQPSQDVGSSLREYRFAAAGDEARHGQSSASIAPAGERALPPAIHNPATPSHTGPGSSSRPSLGKTSSAGRIRHPGQVSAGKSRTRPNIGRRKSSTTKAPAVPNPEWSPEDISMRAGETSEDISTGVRPRGPPPGFPAVPAATSGPVFALPSASSWQSVDSTAEYPGPVATGSSPSASSALVDRGFRGKFVETQKQLSSSASLAPLGRIRKTGSVVRFADEIPQDIGKGKEKEMLHDDRTGPARLRSSLASDALTDEDDSSENEHVGLSRTKSQLSLLIRKKRGETGSQDIGPETRSPSSEDRGKSSEKGKGKDNAQSKEDELLSMGHRGGVTKAGGVQVPKPQRLSERDDPGYISSSSPEPLF